MDISYSIVSNWLWRAFSVKACQQWLQPIWLHFIRLLERPCVLYPVAVWAVTFTLVITVLLSLGFGHRGIIAGSLAAMFQSWMYGGSTPAAGLFATTTSLAMLGWLSPLLTLVAAGLASITAFTISCWWQC